MIDSDEEDGAVLAFGAHASPAEKLPYRIELWDLQRTAVEKVVARAASAALARAIFLAAQNEHLGRYLTLRRGANVISESP